MGIKSRGNFMGVCLRECDNRDECCDGCINFSFYEPKYEDIDEQKE